MKPLRFLSFGRGHRSVPSGGAFSGYGVFASIILVTPLLAQEAPQEPERSGNYGRTPSTVIPYRDFQEPYARFFETVTEFLGTGRTAGPQDHPESMRIGFFGPSGSAPDGDIGQLMLEGVTLAVEQANTAGGCNGIPFEMVIREDLGLWGASSNEMVAFKYEDDVLAVIGSIDGANTHIALRAALKVQMPMVNTAATDPTMTETRIPWILRCMADDRQQGYALAHHIFNECGIENVAAFRVNDRYGRMGIAEFRDAARRLKHPLRVELRWNRGERDFSAQLDRISEVNPEAIVLWGNALDTAAVVRAVRQRNMDVRIFGCDRLASRLFLGEAGEDANGVVAVASFDPSRDDPRLRAFTTAFQERFGHEPEAFAAHGFDGANILIKAIRKAGPNRVLIRDALAEYKHYEGVTGSIEFDTTHNDIGKVYIATVEEGAFVYRSANFTNSKQAKGEVEPYRTLVQSPPAARSPIRVSENASQELRVGCFLPMDEEGEAAVKGIKMALEEDASTHAGEASIVPLVRDSRGAWGDDSSALVDLATTHEVVALIGSTERKGTHLAEMLAAKLHFPVVTLCEDDPTITSIPLAWIFRVGSTSGAIQADFERRFQDRYGEPPGRMAALGYDAASLLAERIRSGGSTRRVLRDRLAAGTWWTGASGEFRFDPLGNRLDRDLCASKGSSDRAEAGFASAEK